MTQDDDSLPERLTESGGHGASAATVCVCLATCRRPGHLRRTLESLSDQELGPHAGSVLRILVVENDPSRLGEAVVEAMRGALPWPVEYEVEDQRGISFARNTLVQLAGDSDWIAFIDDDEIAATGWLAELRSTQAATGADIVLGPVLPRFEKPAGWLSSFFERPRHETGQAVGSTDFRTGNVLIRAALLREIPGPFDPAFALTGGSDGYLGRILEARGARFAWSDEAFVFETIPADRATVVWILRRRFRTGMALSLIRLRMEGRFRGALHALFKSLGAIGLGVLASVRVLVAGRKGLLQAMTLTAFGLGGLFGLVGGRYHEYGSDAQTWGATGRNGRT